VIEFNYLPILHSASLAEADNRISEGASLKRISLQRASLTEIIHGHDK
jgi:hypothetical protein